MVNKQEHYKMSISPAQFNIPLAPAPGKLSGHQALIRTVPAYCFSCFHDFSIKKNEMCSSVVC